MKRTASDLAADPAIDQREIPTPPGGGSWAFDRAKWEWVSNDPAGQQAEPPKE